MSNLVASIVIIAILGAALYYIINQKRNGAKCIGCGSSGCCSSKSKSQVTEIPTVTPSCQCQTKK